MSSKARTVLCRLGTKTFINCPSFQAQFQAKNQGVPCAGIIQLHLQPTPNRHLKSYACATPSEILKLTLS